MRDLILGAAIVVAGFLVAVAVWRGTGLLARSTRFQIVAADGAVAVLDGRTGLLQTFERQAPGKPFLFVGADSRTLARKRQIERR
jgi:hypothetical protein